jgi:hypothetical protein
VCVKSIGHNEERRGEERSGREKGGGVGIRDSGFLLEDGN